MIDTIAPHECTGCKLCGDICPENAIAFFVDAEGFEYPKVDTDKCTQCGACTHKCPSLNRTLRPDYSDPCVYSGWNKDETVRLNSTSGGVYHALAIYIISQGGVVAACAFCDGYQDAHYVIVENERDLQPTMRSKYFQCDSAGIYKKIQEYLKKGRKVLFCGSPCLIAAAQRAADNDANLITMDYICRGNNSPKVYRAFIAELEQKFGSKVAEVHFKNKDRGWRSLGTKITFQNGETYIEDVTESYWINGYIRHNLFMRPACHHCKYRTIPRISDFSVGDFWGIHGAQEDDLFKGISVIMANSGRAKEMMADLNQYLYTTIQSFHVAACGNPCLLESPAIGEHRSVFFTLLQTKPFSDAVAISTGVRYNEDEQNTMVPEEHKPSAFHKIKLFLKKYTKR